MLNSDATIQESAARSAEADQIPESKLNNDMTQRIRLEDTGRPVHHSDDVRERPQRRSNQKKRWHISRKEKITLITLGSVTAVLLIAAIIMISSMFATPVDDGRILKGVVAAGVNLGGLTPEEAIVALENATANTYTKLDMVVTVLDSQITLTPQKTGAKLNIQAVINDAYNYGRVGSRSERVQAKNNALANSVIIPVTPHLNLNTEYIRSELNKLGSQFSSTLSQPSITVTGTKPEMGVEKPDVTAIHQTMSIYMGTAEYGLDTNKLYNQVLEYYNINIFQVVGVCTVVAPDSIEEQLLSFYQQLCVEPVDAKIDPVTYDVTTEVYGYGFNLDAVKDQIARSVYGATINVPLRYLVPNLTADMISGNLFKDVMGDFYSPLTTDNAWNRNATLACQKINGVILKSGDIFSFNEFLGELTESKGYQPALAYRGTRQIMVLGGGVTHTASVLYNSVLGAELEVLERSHHTHAVNFIEVGRDVYVDGKTTDFRFRNNRPDPVRIKAEVSNGQIYISIEGTDTREYRVTLSVEKEVIRPGKLYNVMVYDNPGGYKNGQVLVAGINGYNAEIHCTQYSKTTGLVVKESVVSKSQYKVRDSIVVSLQAKPVVTPTTPPTSDPATSAPTASTGPVNSDPNATGAASGSGAGN